MDDAITALVIDAERTVRRCFPPSAGYETQRTELRGLVDGVRLSVRRGSFHAFLSAHYFVDERPEAHGWAIRMVSKAGQRAPQPPPSARFGRRLAIAMAIAGVAIVLCAAFLASGLWGYFRLSLLMSCMIMMTPVLAWLSGVSSEGASAWPVLPAATGDDFARWHQTLREMDAERALLSDPRALPFRRG